jgi:hypothetical protein
LTAGQSIQWVHDRHYGVPLAKRCYQNKPPSILDAPPVIKWAALDIPDPHTPVGARGIGEPYQGDASLRRGRDIFGACGATIGPEEA